MTINAIVNGQIYMPNKVISKGLLLYSGRKIVAVGEQKEVRLPNTEVTIIDVKGMLVLPGFIDQHVHGGGNADTMDGTYEAICNIARTHARYGTTALCPTTVAAPKKDMLVALRSIADAAEKGCSNGARILGANIEGPFMNSQACGAHRIEFMISPSSDLLSEFQDVARGKVKICTVAPELRGAVRFIEDATKIGVVVSIGHTVANFEEANSAIEAGASCVTHFFNAMTKFHHRHPSILGAVSMDNDIMIELIADRKLVHPTALEMMIRLIGSNRVILVTDSLEAAGTSNIERFDFSGNTLHVRGNSCFLEDGTIWGTLLTMNLAVANVARLPSGSLLDAVNMASFNPARLLGIDQTKGSLEVGKDADILLDDSEIRIHRTIVEGETVYVSEGS